MMQEKRFGHRKISAATAAVVLLVAALVAIEPAPAEAAALGTLDATIVIESQAFPNPPADPDRCVAVAFVEVPEAIGGTDYEVTVFDGLFDRDADYSGPPFPDDDFTDGQFHSVVAAGRHRWALSAVSSGQGCDFAEAALRERWSNPRAKVTSFYLCEGFAVTKVGTDGDDVLVGTKWADTILGLDGNDTLIGKGGDDVLCGNRGRDILNGGRGKDILEGGKGNDVMFGGKGSDMLNGGPGNDTADYANAGSAVVASLKIGQATGEGTDKFFHIENLRGSAFADTLTGSSAPNTLVGRAGRDVLKGQAGNDTLRGNKGDDTLRGGSGSDTGNGGPGTDECIVIEVELNCET